MIREFISESKKDFVLITKWSRNHLTVVYGILVLTKILGSSVGTVYDQVAQSTSVKMPLPIYVGMRGQPSLLEALASTKLEFVARCWF